MNKTLKKILRVFCIVIVVLLIAIVGFIIFFFTRDEAISHMEDAPPFVSYTYLTPYVDETTTEP